MSDRKRRIGERKRRVRRERTLALACDGLDVGRVAGFASESEKEKNCRVSARDRGKTER